MDVIYECAAKFIVLESYQYRFVVSSKRKSRELILDFCDSDFWYLAGLHYLTDISIPKNRRDTLKNIIEKKKITDAVYNTTHSITALTIHATQCRTISRSPEIRVIISPVR